MLQYEKIFFLLLFYCKENVYITHMIANRLKEITIHV